MLRNWCGQYQNTGQNIQHSTKQKVLKCFLEHFLQFESEPADIAKIYSRVRLLIDNLS